MKKGAKLSGILVIVIIFFFPLVVCASLLPEILLVTIFPTEESVLFAYSFAIANLFVYSFL